ncbi:MAG: hypothetical protein JW845_00250 [Dehalococcoidales bacterium]|nr:hypothetical protein [Dehalococcoidales bacterium]
MFTVEADIKKNRLYSKMVGYFDYKEMKECTDKTITEVGKLKPGFDVITDLSEFKPVGQDTLDEVARGQAYLKKSGVRHAIRVEGKFKLASMQFSRMGKSTDYTPDIVATREEAEKLLDDKMAQEQK